MEKKRKNHTGGRCVEGADKSHVGQAQQRLGKRTHRTTWPSQRNVQSIGRE